MKNSSSLNAAKQEANLIVELFQKTDEDNGLMRYGNAFAFLDAAPRFYRGDAKYTPIDRLTKVGLDREFVFNGSKYFISISPHVVWRDVDGVQVQHIVYSSNREEKLERAILKLASDGAIASEAGEDSLKFYVTFSLYQLKVELSKTNNDMSYASIKEGLDVLTSSIIKIWSEDKEKKSEYKGAYFPERLTVEKKTGAKTDLVKLQLTGMHAKAISNGSYRQYLYSRAGKYTKPLSRWLDLYLVHNWKNAGINGKNMTKTMLMSEILEGYGYVRDSRSVKTESRDTLAAIKDLFASKNGSIISKQPRAVAVAWDEDGKATDYSYTFTASQHFIAQQMISNGKALGLSKIRSEKMKQIGNVTVGDNDFFDGFEADAHF